MRPTLADDDVFPAATERAHEHSEMIGAYTQHACARSILEQITSSTGMITAERVTYFTGGDHNNVSREEDDLVTLLVDTLAADLSLNTLDVIPAKTNLSAACRLGKEYNINVDGDDVHVQMHDADTTTDEGKEKIMAFSILVAGVGQESVRLCSSFMAVKEMKFVPFATCSFPDGVKCTYALIGVKKGVCAAQCAWYRACAYNACGLMFRAGDGDKPTSAKVDFGSIICGW